MFAGHDPVIARIAAARRLVPARVLDLAREESGRTGQPLARVLVESGATTREALLAAVAREIGAEYATDVPERLAEPTPGGLDAGLARRFRVVPGRVAADGAVELLAEDPLAPELEADLALALGREVRLVVGDPDRVRALLRRHYGDDVAAGGDAPAAALPAVPAAAEGGGTPDVEEAGDQAPVVQFVNRVLSRAVREKASDVHFEPFEDDYRVRLRVDGALQEVPVPARLPPAAVASRLKVLANLNIAERRRPQDGRMRLTVGGRPVDLRVSTLPTAFGESVVLRVLDQAAVRLELADLGMPAPLQAAVEGIIRRPSGIVVVTGPTGSGKTTTLYSCLRQLNAADAKLLTVEDPVEYEIEGVMQVPVNPAAGLTFASALRSFLRHDPDIVMVGEIRDIETAQIAIQAALTGHLVLTTLHTNDATGAVARLLDMGVEPFLLTATVEAVLAQRLLRRNCPACRRPAVPAPSERAELAAAGGGAAPGRFLRGAGCPGCQGTGYRGRLGVFEFLEMTEELREGIAAGAAVAELRRMARAGGAAPLRETALQAALAGETSLEEVLHHT